MSILEQARFPAAIRTFIAASALMLTGATFVSPAAANTAHHHQVDATAHLELQAKIDGDELQLWLGDVQLDETDVIEMWVDPQEFDSIRLRMLDPSDTAEVWGTWTDEAGHEGRFEDDDGGCFVDLQPPQSPRALTQIKFSAFVGTEFSFDPKFIIRYKGG